MKKYLLAGAALAVIGNPALAQSQTDAADAEENTGGLTVITVTATKKSESARDVPLAVTALGGEQLTNSGVVDTTGLQNVVPAFKAETTYYGNPVYFIRGVGFSDPVATVTPAVSVYVDQVPLPYSIMSSGAILDLERVEILKGPQGTLFGQNATGGAINYIAAKPTNDFSAGINASFGRFNDVQVEGFVSGPITDTLGIRVAGRVEDSSDWQVSESRPNDTRGKREFWNGRVILDWEPSPTVNFRLTGQAWQDDSDTQASQFVLFAPQGPEVAGETYAPAYRALEVLTPTPDNARLAEWDPGSPTESNVSFYQVSLEGKVELSDSIELVSITAYSDIDSYQPTDLDGTAYTDVFSEANVKIDSFYQELRLSGEIGRGSWMIGGNYQKDNYDVLNQFQNGNALTVIAGLFTYTGNDTVATSSVETYAGFASLEYPLTDTITARGSIRYTDITDDHFGCLQAPNPSSNIENAFSFLSSAVRAQIGLDAVFTPRPIAPGSCITLDAQTFLPVGVNTLNKEDNISWRAGLDWKPNPDLLLYVNVGKGYKSGAFTIPPAASSDQLLPLNQESILAYEAGIKSSFLNNNVNFDASVFYYDYTDKQLGGVVNTLVFGPLPTLISIPKSEVLGAEAEITALITPLTRVSVAATYLDTKVKEDPTLPLSPYGEPGSFVGERFPQTSKFAFNVSAEQTIPFGDGSTEGYLGGNVSYRSKAFTQFGSSFSALTRANLVIPSYTLVDLRGGVRFDDGRYGVEVWGRNVFNEFYTTYRQQIADTTVRYAGRPATYGVRLFWKY